MISRFDIQFTTNYVQLLWGRDEEPHYLVGIQKDRKTRVGVEKVSILMSNNTWSEILMKSLRLTQLSRETFDVLF